MVICLKRDASDLHMVLLMHCNLSSVASLKSRMVYLFHASLSRLFWKNAIKWI